MSEALCSDERRVNQQLRQELRLVEPPDPLVVFVALDWVVSNEPPNRFCTVKTIVIAVKGVIRRFDVNHTLRITGDAGGVGARRMVQVYDDYGCVITRQSLEQIRRARAWLLYDRDNQIGDGRLPMICVGTTADAVMSTGLIGCAPAYMRIPAEERAGWCSQQRPVNEMSAESKLTDMLEHVGWRAEYELVRSHSSYDMMSTAFLHSVQLARPTHNHLFCAYVSRDMFRPVSGLEFVESGEDWEEELSFRSPLWKAMSQYRRFVYGL
jgi:hypothetical protein